HGGRLGSGGGWGAPLRSRRQRRAGRAHPAGRAGEDRPRRRAGRALAAVARRRLSHRHGACLPRGGRAGRPETPLEIAMEFLRDTWFLFLRLVRATLRMPVFVIISIVQPILWVLLFGQLFRAVTTIPGFGSDSYVQFLAPGIAIMTALFSAAYSGMGMIGDIDRGVLDRLLATPASRGALIAGRILHAAVQVILQAAIILGVAFLLGARPHGGVLGVLVVLFTASLLGAAFASFSNGLALLARRQELVIAVMNFIVLPMTFLSSMIMS